MTKKVVLASHLVDWNFLALSKKVFDGMTPEQQQTVIDAAWAAAGFGQITVLAEQAHWASLIWAGCAQAGLLARR